MVYCLALSGQPGFYTLRFECSRQLLDAQLPRFDRCAGTLRPILPIKSWARSSLGQLEMRQPDDPPWRTARQGVFTAWNPYSVVCLGGLAVHRRRPGSKGSDLIVIANWFGTSGQYSVGRRGVTTFAFDLWKMLRTRYAQLPKRSQWTPVQLGSAKGFMTPFHRSGSQLIRLIVCTALQTRKFRGDDKYAVLVLAQLSSYLRDREALEAALSTIAVRRSSK